MTPGITFLVKEEVREFLKEWEEHHTLSRNLLVSFDYVFKEKDVMEVENGKHTK